MNELTTADVAAICTGDPEAWAAFYARYISMAAVWARRAGADADAVEDHAADAMRRLWQGIMSGARFEAPGELMGYLKRAAQSSVFDAARKVRAVTVDLDGPAALSVGVSNPEIDGLGDMLAGLPEVQRLALWLRSQGEAPREIAQLRPDVFTSVADVYDAIRHGLGRLRRRMGQPEEVQAPTVPAPVITLDPVELVRRRLARGVCPVCTAKPEGARTLCEACRATLCYCPGCERVKPHAQFGAAAPIDRRRGRTLRTYCVDCERVRSQANNEAAPCLHCNGQKYGHGKLCDACAESHGYCPRCDQIKELAGFGPIAPSKVRHKVRHAGMCRACDRARYYARKEKTYAAAD